MYIPPLETNMNSLCILEGVGRQFPTHRRYKQEHLGRSDILV